MKQTLPWSVTGIPPEVREAARAAALREGVSVGDWLTRRIVALDEAAATAPEAMAEPEPYRFERPEPPRREREPEAKRERETVRDRDPVRDRDDLTMRLTRNEAEADSAMKRIDEAVRAMSRRLESTERSHGEVHRAVTTATSEINAATRDQAQAFAHLTQRMDQIERQNDTAGLREAVRGLHQGLSRLADQNAHIATETTNQVAALAVTMESLLGKVGRARDEAGEIEQFVHDRFASISERLRQTEERIASGGHVQELLAELDARMKTSEKRMEDLLARDAALGDRFEKTAAALDSRMAASENQMKSALSRQAAPGAKDDATPALEARIKATEDQVKSALTRQALTGARLEDSMSVLDARVKSTEERLQEAFGRHLASIERNLENIAERIEHAERRTEADSSMQDALRLFSQRMDSADKKNRDALIELKTVVADAAKRIEAVETAQHAPQIQAVQAPQAQPAQPQPLQPQPVLPQLPQPAAAVQPPVPLSDLSILDAGTFDIPPFPDAPPFPGGSFNPPRPGEDLNPPLAAEGADVFQSRPELVPHAAQDYLAQARRAAQAAADPGTIRNVRGQLGGFTDAAGGEILERKRSKISRPIAAAVIGLLILSAGLLLARMLTSRDSVFAIGPGTQIGLNDETGNTPAPSSVASLPAPASGSIFAAPGANIAVATPASAPARDALPGRTASNSAPRTPVSVTPAPPLASSIERLTVRATQGDVKAALVLGLKYADGDGVASNDRDALRWLQKAADSGEAVAQYRLGTLYEKGRGVAADAKQATAWYSKAAERGNRKAMHNLAVVYADGNGPEKNFAEAARWFRAAADLGLTDSQFNLAVLYERGLGVPASLTDAYKWYSIAAAAGDSESKVRVEALNTQLQPAEKSAAEQAIKAYRPQALDLSANEPPALAQVISVSQEVRKRNLEFGKKAYCGFGFPICDF